MSDDRRSEDERGAQGAPRRWEPLPQGEYDAEATAFVQFPEGALDEIAGTPLAAPGHGYVPPQITVAPAAAEATDPAGAGSWTVPDATSGTQAGQPGQRPAQPQQVHWPDPGAGAFPENQAPAPGQDPYGYQQGATGQWPAAGYTGADGGYGDGTGPGEAQAAPDAGPSDVTGQWSIPVARGDLPDESGEFTASGLASQWGGTPPATLPGGASAPWATGAEAGQPWGAEVREDAAAGPAGPAAYPAPDDPQDPAQAHPPYGAAQAQSQAPGAGAPAGARPPQRKRRPIADRRLAVREQLDRAEALRAGDGPVEGAPGPAWAPDTAPAPAGGTPAAGTPATGTPAAGTPVPGTPAAGTPVPAAEGAVRDVEHEARYEPAVEAPGEPHDAAAAAERGATAQAAARQDTATGPAARGHAPAEAAGPEPGQVPEDGPGAGAVHAQDSPVEAAPLPHDEHPLGSYVLRVNGADRPVTGAWIGESLLYVLRERLGLAGAKDGCSQGECGACNVQVDGRLVASCLVPAATAAGSEVRTVEGLATDGQPSDVQRSLARCGAVQCGFCVPGMAMTVHDLLEGNPSPSDLEARQALSGNLCRCSGYRGVLDAVRDVVAGREASSAAAEPEEPGPQGGADEARIPHQAGPGGGSAGGRTAPAATPHRSFDPPARHEDDGGRA